MNIIELVKDSWLFDDHFKTITASLIVTSCIWSIRSVRRVFFPFLWIFKNNLSSVFFKLSPDEKSNALKIIGEHNEKDNEYDILTKEIKLKQYGLFYPLPILKELFHYIYDKNILMNSTGFLSFIDCNQIFDYDRETMPTLSPKKITLYTIAYIVFFSFLVWYSIDVMKLINELYHTTANAINTITIVTMLFIVVVIFRIAYIIIENFVSFFWAIKFSIKLKKHALSKKHLSLVEKYKM